MPTLTTREYFNAKPNPVKAYRIVTIELSHPDLPAISTDPSAPAGIRRFVNGGDTSLVNGLPIQMFGLESGALHNGGETVAFRALQFIIDDPDIQENTNINIPVQLGRVGSEMRRTLKNIRGFGWLRPARMTYRVYLSNATDKPQYHYRTFIADINFSGTDVSLTTTDTNPVNRDVSRAYTFQDFPGLRETI